MFFFFFGGVESQININISKNIMGTKKNHKISKSGKILRNLNFSFNDGRKSMPGKQNKRKNE